MNTDMVLTQHIGNSDEGNAEKVFTFMSFTDANAFAKANNFIVISKRRHEGAVKVPETIGGGWVYFMARQVFGTIDGKRVMLQCHVGNCSPYLEMSVKW